MPVTRCSTSVRGDASSSTRCTPSARSRLIRIRSRRCKPTRTSRSCRSSRRICADRRRGDRCRLHLELPRTRRRQGCAARHTSRVPSSLATERLDPRSHAERALPARSVLGLPRSPRAVDARQPGRSAPAHGVPGRTGHSALPPVHGQGTTPARARRTDRAVPPPAAGLEDLRSADVRGRSEKSDAASGRTLRRSHGPALHRRGGVVPQGRTRATSRTCSRGEFAAVRGRGGPGDEHACFDERLAWEQRARRATAGSARRGRRSTAAAALPLVEQVIFYEEYARAGGPGRRRHRRRGPARADDRALRHRRSRSGASCPASCAGDRDLVPGLLRARTPAPTSPTSQTRAERDGDEWVITGQKVWTSLAHWAHWCFVLCRTDRDAPKHKGISYLLVPMDAARHRDPARSCRSPAPSEFNEVVLRRRPHAGRPTSSARSNGGWRSRWARSRSSAARRRSASSSRSSSELRGDHRRARGRTAGATDPGVRQRLADAWIAARRSCAATALRMLTTPIEHGADAGATSIHKLYWARLHRDARRARASTCSGRAGDVVPTACPYELTDAQRLFLYTRADTIYGGSNQIQRNIIGERALGLPPEPKVSELRHRCRPTTRPGHGLLAGQDGARHRGRGHRHRLRDRQAVRRGRRAGS